MFEFLKSKSFPVIASFILGLGLVAVFRPGCVSSDGKQEGSCTVLKAPPLDEVKSSTYQIGHKCYQFKVEPTECSSSGVVEPFQETVLR